MKGPRTKVLIVDDEPSIRFVLSEALRSWGYEPSEAATVAQAKRVFADEEPAIALLDIDLPDGSGLDVLAHLRDNRTETIGIMITGNVSVANAVTALRSGAHDFIGKPVHLEELRVTLRNALETHELRREVRRARNEKEREFNFSQLIGDSPPMRAAVELGRRVAESDVAAVLLQGETGTGKDLFARAIHYASDRASSPYLAINCAALPATLIESELFGYEKGAFTDAKQRKEGLFEQAQSGSIFLDEIGELEISLQAKLLRVLEEGAFRRVGGLKDIPLDVRIIAASNQNLKRAGEDGTFRLDLYFRLAVIQIDIPPLRERGNDVLLLARHYIDKANEKRRGTKLSGLSNDVARIFKTYSWKGNVRELRNVIERASILEDRDLVSAERLPADMLRNGASISKGGFSITLPDAGIPLRTVEFELAQQAYERTRGNLTQAAKLLGISRDQLRYKLKKSDAGQDTESQSPK